MSKDEFIKELLTGLTNPPGYFPKNVLMNIQGYESLDDVMERAEKPLSVKAFELLADEKRPLILDTRPADVFHKGFVPNSINIGLDSNFAMWVGELIPDIKQEILLVTEPGKEEESIIRLSRVGYDHAIGYLDGGFEAWKKEGKEVDTAKRISASELKARMDAGVKVFDVRKESEFNAQHIKGAINTPLNQLNEHLASFPKDEEFVIHCAGGYRSMIASSILKSRGWENFEDVIGGFDAIQETDIPVTEYVCPTTLL